MKKSMMCMSMCASLLFTNGFAQSFVETIEADAMVGLYGNECFLTLGTGEELHGTFSGCTFVNNGFSRITVELANGEKLKLSPDQLVSLHIRSSDLLKLMMISESGESLRKMANTDYKDIINREYIIFESALTPRKTDTRRLLQLLNPGFDNRLKVFADPNAKTGGFSVDGIQVTGGEDAAYLFVKNGEKAFRVKKGSYSRDFAELFSDCPDMQEAFRDMKIEWEDTALHVYYYNQFCE